MDKINFLIEKSNILTAELNSAMQGITKLKETTNKTVNELSAQINNSLLELQTNLNSLEQQNLNNLENLQNEINNNYTTLSNDINKIQSNFINDNLLINGGFTINQRGNQIYTTNKKYSFDRWILLKNNDSFIDTNNKILSSGQNGTYCILRQFLEDDITPFLKGKKVTFSIDVASVDLTNAYVQIGYYREGSFTQLARKTTTLPEIIRVSVTTTIPNDLLDTDHITVGIYTNKGSFYFNNAKLEIGEKATQYTYKRYFEEIIFCQRYFQLKSNNYTFPANELDRTPIMRKTKETGTLTINNQKYNYADSEIY